jgi:hypothetical protein
MRREEWTGLDRRARRRALIERSAAGMEPLGTDGLTASAGEEPVRLAVACDGTEAKGERR